MQVSSLSELTQISRENRVNKKLQKLTTHHLPKSLKEIDKTDLICRHLLVQSQQ